MKNYCIHLYIPGDLITNSNSLFASESFKRCDFSWERDVFYAMKYLSECFYLWIGSKWGSKAVDKIEKLLFGLINTNILILARPFGFGRHEGQGDYN